jgi:hypothetical protein
MRRLEYTAMFLILLVIVIPINSSVVFAQQVTEAKIYGSDKFYDAAARYGYRKGLDTTTVEALIDVPNVQPNQVTIQRTGTSGQGAPFTSCNNVDCYSSAKNRQL